MAVELVSFPSCKLHFQPPESSMNGRTFGISDGSCLHATRKAPKVELSGCHEVPGCWKAAVAPVGGMSMGGELVELGTLGHGEDM